MAEYPIYNAQGQLMYKASTGEVLRGKSNQEISIKIIDPVNAQTLQAGNYPHIMIVELNGGVPTNWSQYKLPEVQLGTTRVGVQKISLSPGMGGVQRTIFYGPASNDVAVASFFHVVNNYIMEIKATPINFQWVSDGTILTPPPISVPPPTTSDDQSLNKLFSAPVLVSNFATNSLALRYTVTNTTVKWDGITIEFAKTNFSKQITFEGKLYTSGYIYYSKNGQSLVSSIRMYNTSGEALYICPVVYFPPGMAVLPLPGLR